VIARMARYLANNALGALALFVALGGVSYAATAGFNSGGKLQACVNGNGSLRLVKAGKSCHHGQQKLAWNQTGVQGPKGATGATGPSGIEALKGAAVPTATNALALGGTPATGFTHSDCESETGQIKGFVEVPANISETPTKLAGYNCSGEAIEANRTIKGFTHVHFVGSPVTIAVGNIDATLLDNTGWVTVQQDGPGEFDISTLEPTVGAVNVAYSLITP
jgi:hypothetical protein